MSTNASSEIQAPDPAALARTRGSRRLRRASRGAAWIERSGALLCIAAVVAAPLVAGAVHRSTILAVVSVVGLGLVLFALGLALQGRALRFGVALALPLALLLIPVMQSIPLPLGIRAWLDPAGTALLRDNTFAAVSAWPLSLDPVATRLHIGRAAAALAIFILAYHLSSGQRRRHLLPRAIAVAGISAVAIGLGHRIFGFDKLYGTLTATHRALLVGPFVNSNHTGELLEIATFVCLGCSFQSSAPLNRIGWMIAGLFCAGGAVATLSRGTVAAFAMGVSVYAFLRYMGRDDSPERKRRSLAWGALLFGLFVLGAGAFGAERLIDRFRGAAVSSDIRFQVWRDSLNVLRAHPLGIGRGSFDRVFPIYQTFNPSMSIRFAFVENQPLQLLLDSGYVLFAILIAAGIVVAWRMVKQARRDRIEAAYLAALFAVAAHSVVDFGLETLGVLLPAMAVLGMVIGRTRSQSADKSSSAPAPARAGWGVAAIAVGGLIVGLVSTAHSSNDDFDSLLKTNLTVDQQRAVLQRAQMVHPVDYFYVLRYARLEPLKDDATRRSPRMRALNRALRLCPSCDVVHLEIARNLWQLGRRRQALLEWRTAVDLRPEVFQATLGELFAAGAKAEEMTAVAASHPHRMVDVAWFLSRVSRTDDAFVALDQAEAMNAPRVQTLVVRGTLQLQASKLAAARDSVARARALKTPDTRLDMLEAQVLLASKGAEGADDALAVLDSAATRDAYDLAVQRARLDLVWRYARWQAASRALDGFKQALFRAHGTAAEAYIFSARIEAQLGHTTAALGAYRIALAENRTDVGLWLEYGRYAEKVGRDATAREAYVQASRLMPSNKEVSQALKAVDERLSKARETLNLGGR